jgi:hypothetical protein
MSGGPRIRVQPPEPDERTSVGELLALALMHQAVFA